VEDVSKEADMVNAIVHGMSLAILVVLGPMT